MTGVLRLLAIGVAGLSLGLQAAPVANRTAVHRGDGVLRWADDGSEVAVFGVNYYTPFHVEYEETAKRGFDHKDVIRRDVAHLRRLGFNAVRLHCFDREISDRQGNLIDNHRLELLDYLIAECASNGMWTVLTPIAGWGLQRDVATNGFSSAANRARLASEPQLIAIQQRYEEAFARHVNRFTGLRYADDPAVLCFELINEPAYPEGYTGEQIAAYANALLEGIRRSGTTKPVFYSALWNQKSGAACVPFLKTDGVSAVCYCTGLRAGHALEGPQLGKVKTCHIDTADPHLARLAKIVYEFDAADMTGAYMYPAMAKMFRSCGVQSATQFQYESTPVAPDNPCYKTHYMHLIYTPAKAISLAIAAEAFRRLPRGGTFTPNDAEILFPPFRVNVAADLSEMATETDYLYSARPLTPPPDPTKLQRVWGCGKSSVVASEGTGAYFLDKVSAGVWRLQVFPSVLPIADPHTGLPCPKVAILPDEVAFTVALPDLGERFDVRRQGDASLAGTAVAGRFRVMPGDYVLTREGLSGADVAKGQAYDLPTYWAPAADKPDPSWRRWPPTWEDIVAEARTRATTADQWNFFDRTVAACAGGWLVKEKDGVEACRYRVDNFVDRNTISSRVSSKGKLWAALFPDAPEAVAVILSGRSATAYPEPVEVAFKFEDGQVWGTDVTFTPEGTPIRLDFDKLRYFSHWPQVPPRQKGMRPDLRRLVEINLCTGRWLNPTSLDRAHSFQITSVLPVLQDR
ncbi:MAG: glycoside hydrolase family 5 protein [Kiritimatiellae bacterium]|nr:glycoside hydrolase family 5 protein [Kiritimatiellia bacterium]